MCLFPADDMGLGKTLTMIALILAQKQLKPEKRKETLEIWLSKNGTELFPSYSTYMMMQCHVKCLKHYRLMACKTTDSICSLLFCRKIPLGLMFNGHPCKAFLLISVICSSIECVGFPNSFLYIVLGFIFSFY